MNSVCLIVQRLYRIIRFVVYLMPLSILHFDIVVYRDRKVEVTMSEYIICQFANFLGKSMTQVRTLVF